MHVSVITYGAIAQGANHRLGRIAWLLAEMASQGKTVQLVHPSQEAARSMEADFDTPVLSTYELSFSFVNADIICLIDGDIIDEPTVRRLETLRKDVYLIVPDDAVPTLRPGVSLHDVLKDVLEERRYVPALTGGEEQPKTFGCHHFGPTCRNCDSLVAQWKAKRRERALAPAA